MTGTDEYVLADAGLLAVQTKTIMSASALRRYRPINAASDIVEMNGDTFDEVLLVLVRIAKLSGYGEQEKPLC